MDRNTTVNVKGAFYAESTSRSNSTTVANTRNRRRLVDYTKCRSDGTASSKSNNSKHATQYPRNALKMGLPTCFALEASLVEKEVLTDTTSDKVTPDRIKFNHYVEARSQLKPSRVSTLDRTNSRSEVLRQTYSRSRHHRKHVRSIPTPIPSMIETRAPSKTSTR
jgi:hypothetical protein